MNQSAYLFVVIVFAVFLSAVVVSNGAAGVTFVVLKQLTKRKVRRLV